MFRIVLLLELSAGYFAAQLVVCAKLEVGEYRVYRVGPALRFRCYDRFQPRTDRQFRRFGWQAAVIAWPGVAGSFAAVSAVRRYFSGTDGGAETKKERSIADAREEARLILKDARETAGQVQKELKELSK